MSKSPMWSLSMKSVAIVSSSAKYLRQASKLLQCLSRFVQVHANEQDAKRTSRILKQIELCERRIQLGSTLNTTVRVLAKIPESNFGTVCVSGIQTYTDTLAHELSVLPEELRFLAFDLERASNGNIKARGSVPGIATIIKRLNTTANQGTQISACLYEVALQLAELRVAAHADPDAPDDYRRRYRLLSTISKGMYASPRRTTARKR